MRGRRRAALLGIALLGAAALLAVAGPPVAAADSCPNSAFRIGASAELPDCRAYEMVTPPDKPAEPYVGGIGYGFAATPDGNHVFFNADQPVVWQANDWPTANRADRGPGGWNALSVLPPGPPTEGDQLIQSFSPQNLSVVIKTPVAYDPSDTDGGTLYAANDLYKVGADGQTTFLTSSATGPGTGPPGFLDSSEDGETIIFNSKEPLLPGVEETIGVQLYEFHDGHLELASAKDNGQPLSQEAMIGGPESGFNALSRNGSALFFTAPGAGLFVRVDGSTPEPVPAGANGSSVFKGATANGSEAFFETTVQLVPEDTDSSTDLYRYDVATKAVQLLTTGGDVVGGADPVWASENGQRVYFEAQGALAPGADPGNGMKTYLWDHGTIKLVANGSLVQAAFSGNKGPTCGLSRATPDGRYLVAETTESLSPADTDAGASDVYLYDAVTEDLTLVSTSPSDPQGEQGAFITPQPRRAGEQACDNQYFLVPTHPLSNSGDVFFQTKAALLPEDVNGRLDVYEWHRQSGQLSLISSGRGPDDSVFLDATPSGSDVFFLSRDRLVRSDEDGSFDFYDARVGGGFPEPEPAQPCADSGCQGGAATPPGFSAPTSSAFRGAGNVKAVHPRHRRCRSAHAHRRAGRARCTRRHHHRSQANSNRRTSR